MFRSACLSFRQSMSWIFTLRSEYSLFGVNIHRINHPAISPCRIPTWKPIRMHFSSKSYVYAVIFRKTALCGMITYSYKIHISPHRLTTGPEQNHKIIVKEVPLSESTCSFTPRDFPHRKEAIFMYYSDIDEDDLDGLPSILTPAMAADTLCVHINTIYNLLRSGKMTGFRMGAAWRICKKDLLEFLRQGGSLIS